jgi:8-oxo-dGTP pyrophosphatase MutT (NUDIX family)
MPGMTEDIREAASVIAARDGERGVEVLVLERSARSRFLPGYVAFPGGAADAGDEALAERWFGAAAEARRACAVRELFEEVGLALTSGGLRPTDSDSLEAVDARPPRIGQLRRIAHWIAPKDVPVRFDAEYFAIEADPHVEPRPDGNEIARAWWASPRELLGDWEHGRRKLYWPTMVTMRALAACGDVGELLRLEIHTYEPDEDALALLPRSTFWQDDE